MVASTFLRTHCVSAAEQVPGTAESVSGGAAAARVEVPCCHGHHHAPLLRLQRRAQAQPCSTRAARCTGQWSTRAARCTGELKHSCSTLHWWVAALHAALVSIDVHVARCTGELQHSCSTLHWWVSAVMQHAVLVSCDAHAARCTGELQHVALVSCSTLHYGVATLVQHSALVSCNVHAAHCSGELLHSCSLHAELADSMQACSIPNKQTNLK